MNPSVALTLSCLLAMAVLVVAERRGPLVVRAGSKALASAAFVALGILRRDGGPDDLIVLGLVLSLVGDLLLLGHARASFLLGIGVFLLAHVAYGAAFLALGVDPKLVALALVPLAVLGVVVWRWLGPHTGSLRPAVLAYMVAITAMVALAVGSTSPLLVLAAVLFFLSDLAVARDRFVTPGWANRAIGLPLYYGAQLLFAWWI